MNSLHKAKNLANFLINSTCCRPLRLNSLILIILRLGNAMDFLDSVFLSVYVCEMILKSYVYHADYFHGWDLLDFFIVCVSLFDVGMAVKSSSTTSVAKGSNGGSAVKATKLLRVLRASRMLR